MSWLRRERSRASQGSRCGRWPSGRTGSCWHQETRKAPPDLERQLARRPLGGTCRRVVRRTCPRTCVQPQRPGPCRRQLRPDRPALERGQSPVHPPVLPERPGGDIPRVQPRQPHPGHHVGRWRRPPVELRHRGPALAYPGYEQLRDDAVRHIRHTVRYPGRQRRYPPPEVGTPAVPCLVRDTTAAGPAHSPGTPIEPAKTRSQAN
jgi:hypothetical protein